MNKAHLMTGYSNHRQQFDFYPTPAPATLALLEHENFSGTILEPASGQGHISKILEARFSGQKILSYDLRAEGYGTGGINFLKQTSEFYGYPENIVTNPPYKLLNEFILHSKKIATQKIAMLLQLQALGGKAHHNLIWADKQFPLKKVICLKTIPHCIIYGLCGTVIMWGSPS
ncbi:MAG TPA: class I SAM-dependent methyltransferase [Candidatus Eremiobacteraeota bacterium]|nr:class I SAM-dependent methyltransferase [Candidatus Eremiobacteraeota bacterium]